MYIFFAIIIIIKLTNLIDRKNYNFLLVSKLESTMIIMMINLMINKYSVILNKIKIQERNSSNVKSRMR
jgi:hypothetical protein